MKSPTLRFGLRSLFWCTFWISATLGVWLGLYSEHSTELYYPGSHDYLVWHVSYHNLHLWFNAERDEAFVRLEYLIAIAVTTISGAAVIGRLMGRQWRFIGLSLTAIAVVVLLYLSMIAIGWPYRFAFRFQ